MARRTERKAETRECPVDGCDNRHARSLLMCRDHWFSLPKPLRDDLMRAYRRHGVLSEEYWAAREACIANAEGRDPIELKELDS